MNRTGIPSDISQQVRTLRIIWFALMTGMVTAIGVFWYLREEGVMNPPARPGAVAPLEEPAHGHDEAEEPPLGVIFAGIGLVLLVSALVIPPQMGAKMPARFTSYQSMQILQGAMFEGGGMLQGIAYLLEGQWWSLVLAGVFLGMMLVHVPTRDRATRWIQRRQMAS